MHREETGRLRCRSCLNGRLVPRFQVQSSRFKVVERTLNFQPGTLSYFTPPLCIRVLLKLSGEALMGGHRHGIDTTVAESVAREIRAVHDLGVEVAVVVGGGN